jgi:hypothetical protein
MQNTSIPPPWDFTTYYNLGSCLTVRGGAQKFILKHTKGCIVSGCKTNNRPLESIWTKLSVSMHLQSGWGLIAEKFDKNVPSRGGLIPQINKDEICNDLLLLLLLPHLPPSCWEMTFKFFIDYLWAGSL